MDNDLMTVGRAAEVLGVSPLTVRHHIQRGIIECQRLSTPRGSAEQYVLSAAEVERHLRERGYGAKFGPRPKAAVD